MIQIVEVVYKTIDQYREYLFQEGLTSKERAKQKVDLMIQALDYNLGGIVTHRISPYKALGSEERCFLYVYQDHKSKTQWGFAYKRFNDNDNDNDVIVYYMRNLKLIKEDN